MRLSKSFMLSSAVVLTMLPVCLSAITMNSDEPREYDNGRHCVAQTIKAEPFQKEEQSSWFSSFRKNVGNAFRTAGDSLRTEGDKSAVGQVKEFVKNSALTIISKKTGIPLDRAKETICTALGNGLRTIGQWIKGGEPTQTTTRVILDNLGLKKSSKDHQVAHALRTAARNALKADEATAIEEYKLVVEGMLKRGYATKAQIQAVDINGIYLEVLSEEELRKNSALTCDAFAKAVKVKSFEALKNLKNIKDAPIADKLNLMNQHLKGVYENIKLKQEFDQIRNKLITAPAA